MVSVPISIPMKQRRPSSPDHSPSAKEFIPPHQLSQQRHSHLAQSVPLTSSAQLRTRDLLMTATGLLPRHGPDGALLQQPHGTQSNCPASEDSGSTPMRCLSIQRQWEGHPLPSADGVAHCTGGISCPGRDMQPFLRRTAPLERQPRQFAMLPEGH